MKIIQNPELQLAFDFVQYTHVNVFLTGKAGTGKTTFLHNLKKVSPKRMIVVAPTGVAAINAGGVTIHSFFQMPFGPQIPVDAGGQVIEIRTEERAAVVGFQKLSREKINIIKSLDLLVIDEISMVRADLLDAVDAVLRRYRDRLKPFGGVQLMMIGDIQQLAPVVKEEDRDLLKPYYDTFFFFGSRALQKTQFVTIELKHIFRQSDRIFIDLLNKIRDNRLDTDALRELNKRYQPEFVPSNDEGFIILTTHNIKAQEVNSAKLNNLKTKSYTFEAEVEGEFPAYAYPTEARLTLKAGAQVMFVKNDPSAEKRYFNGKIGKISEIEDELLYVVCPDEDSPIAVEKVEWQNMKYSLDEETKDIQETVIGSFVQYPLKLAWAITIHKSQGLTFDKAVIDARSAFAHGQVYVALSRCRTLDGLVLSTPLSGSGIITDRTVSEFSSRVERDVPGPEDLSEFKKEYQQMLLDELFDFEPLQRNVHYCMKVYREHQQVVFGNLHEILLQLNDSLQREMISVAGKFGVQLQGLLRQGPDVESNTLLQDRVKKACRYFLEKLQGQVLRPLETIVFETDNKEVSKAIQRQLERIQQEGAVRLACLSSGCGGFIVREYLGVRAKASIETPVVKKSKRKTEAIAGPGTVAHPELYNRLASWRAGKSLALNVPIYRILRQKTLFSLVQMLPLSLPALKSVKGMGGKKTNLFGREILDIISSYCTGQHLVSQIPLEPENSPEKPVRSDTKTITYNLWKSGKNLREIAAARGMAVTTIEGHLAHFVGTGELDLEHFVASEKARKIAECFTRLKTSLLSPVKEDLGEDYTYSELRFVLKHMEFEEKFK
jgi:hypothetical protein